jgi:alkylation response protein AidB-like acyl-CoA dehydrogenase
VERRVYSQQHDAFREIVRAFFVDELLAEYPAWEAAGRPPRDFWTRAGDVGILGIGVPPEYGGLPDATFKHSAIVTEEAQRAGLVLGGVRVQTDICMPYFLEYASEEQRTRWLPGLASGELVSAIAMTEPGAGSDMKAMSTRAVRDGDHYVVNGAKTFITNGLSANLAIVAVKTDPPAEQPDDSRRARSGEAGRRAGARREGISLLVVPAHTPGYERGRKLEKIGLRTQDLAELSFTDMVVPCENLLGEENRGFEYLTSNLAQERLSIALNSQAAAVAALQRALEALRAASGGGGPEQATKFTLAACKAEVEAGQALADRALERHADGELTPSDAAIVKLFCTELQGRVTDRCLQLIGPAAYARTSPLGRAFADARVSRIYGGSSEIMKVIVAKAIGL